jgi:hypothetical protein
MPDEEEKLLRLAPLYLIRLAYVQYLKGEFRNHYSCTAIERVWQWRIQGRGRVPPEFGEEGTPMYLST